MKKFLLLFLKEIFVEYVDGEMGLEIGKKFDWSDFFIGLINKIIFVLMQNELQNQTDDPADELDVLVLLTQWMKSWNMIFLLSEFKRVGIKSQKKKRSRRI